jgi:cytochrome c biogenesis protein CcmG, thiol:disulfide interchange protein DsbE
VDAVSQTPPGRRDRRKLVGAIAGGAVVIAVVALLAIGLANRGVGTHIDDSLTAGERPAAPGVTLPVLIPGSGLPAGGQGSLAQLRGRPVVLNFWASWCDPCRDEAPVLERLWQRYRDRGVVVLGVDARDLREKALAFSREYGLTYPSLRDGTDRTERAFETTGVPETFLIDRTGRVALHITGPIGASQEDEVAARIRALL